jgi:hypothetical protein
LEKTSPEAEKMKGFDFLTICRLYDRVVSSPIKTKEHRVRIANQIKMMVDDGFRVRCFRDAKGFIMIAARKPRLDDFF